ncbi:MAG: GNAT family N-acetyltransferase [Flavobacteriales bacterium]|nr:GNAT family N-acetyltransferase [Flavobacteriales bacterium]
MIAPHSRLIRTDSGSADFRSLVSELDKDLAVRDGDEHAFFAQYNGLQDIKHVVVIMYGDRPAGCGAFKSFDARTVEIKRMFTATTHRQQGIGSAVLNELEIWARELGYRRCVLETGKQQHEAIALYAKRGYSVTPNYGQYIGVESSVCFEKEI